MRTLKWESLVLNVEGTAIWHETALIHRGKSLASCVRNLATRVEIVRTVCGSRCDTCYFDDEMNGR